jgi:hypothetical protein
MVLLLLQRWLAELETSAGQLVKLQSKTTQLRMAAPINVKNAAEMFNASVTHATSPSFARCPVSSLKCAFLCRTRQMPFA